MHTSKSFTALASCAITASALQAKGDIGKLPALGWNSWNAYGCDVNQDKILQAAQAFLDLGLKDAGYEYVNIDDCWSVKDGRDNATNRLQPDLTKFPDGINGTAAKVHDMGLKIGIYSSAGTQTCAGYPASIGYEAIDAATWAEWSIDYLKLDNCNVPSNWTDTCNACWLDRSDGPNGTCVASNQPLCPEGYDYSQSNTAHRYAVMRDAILAQDRPILYALCEWGTEDVISWGNQTAHSWRTTDDINPSWSRILSILNQNSFMTNAADFHGHNDPDMLEVGNGNLTYEENRSHFALWAALKSPLLIGTNLQNLSQQLLNVIKNPYLIAFNQDDQMGQPAAPYKWGYNLDWTFDASRPAQYWAGQSSNGTLVLLLNTNDTAQSMTLEYNEIESLKGADKYQVVDAWSGQRLGCQTGAVSTNVSSHDTAVFIIQDKC